MSDYTTKPGEVTDKELLRWVYQKSREALMKRTHREAAKAALDALSEINKRLADYK
jgi:hypothetical protein